MTMTNAHGNNIYDVSIYLERSQPCEAPFKIVVSLVLDICTEIYKAYGQRDGFPCRILLNSVSIHFNFCKQNTVVFLCKKRIKWKNNTES
jgi:hypothetical protein